MKPGYSGIEKIKPNPTIWKKPGSGKPGLFTTGKHMRKYLTIINPCYWHWTKFLVTNSVKKGPRPFGLFLYIIKCFKIIWLGFCLNKCIFCDDCNYNNNTEILLQLGFNEKDKIGKETAAHQVISPLLVVIVKA